MVTLIKVGRSIIVGHHLESMRLYRHRLRGVDKDYRIVIGKRKVGA